MGNMIKIAKLNMVDAHIHCADCGEFLAYPIDYLRFWRPLEEVSLEEAVREYV